MKAISKPTKVITVFLCLVLALSPFTAFAAEYAIPDILADNGLPVVNITIDESAEGFGTIEEMNGSPDHSVKCTGSSSAASGGAVQTGQSSVAFILLLTLAAAVCLIFCFNFQRSKEEH